MIDDYARALFIPYKCVYDVDGGGGSGWCWMWIGLDRVMERWGDLLINILSPIIFPPLFPYQLRDDHLYPGEASSGRDQAAPGSRCLHVPSEC